MQSRSAFGAALPATCMQDTLVVSLDAWRPHRSGSDARASYGAPLPRMSQVDMGESDKKNNREWGLRGKGAIASLCG